MSLKDSTVNLFIESISKIMVTDLSRITVDEEWIRDTQTNVTIRLSKTGWIMYVPNTESIPAGAGVYLLDNHKKKLKDAMNERSDVELIMIHERLYDNDYNYISFSEIQKMRKEKPMVEEAWQQLLTVYALNMDGDNNVS